LSEGQGPQGLAKDGPPTWAGLISIVLLMHPCRLSEPEARAELASSTTNPEQNL